MQLPLDFGESWRFTTLYGATRSAPCPRCGVTLRWRPSPHRVLNLGACIEVLGWVTSWVAPKASIYQWLAVFAVVLGAALMLLGYARLRLENQFGTGEERRTAGREEDGDGSAAWRS